MPKNDVDETSLKILSLLQTNARMSFTEIGKIVGMTPSSVAERVKKLESDNIIEGYTVKVNPSALGFPMSAVMLISLTGIFSKQETNIVTMLSKYHQVTECLRITGKNDFLVKIIVNSIDEFKIINDEVAKLGQVDTSIVVESFVQNTTIDFQKMLTNLKKLN